MTCERRVIYDSEDDDGEEGFSLPNSPSRASITERDNNARNDGGDGESTRTINDDKDNPNVGSTSDARSTDPEFFRQLYESAQRTPVTDVIIPDTAPQHHIRPGQTSSDRREKASSSITDPPSTRTKRIAMAQMRSENRQLDDCTQITTPAAPVSGQRDIYEFTLSDEELPRANSIFAPRKRLEGEKKNKKRKRAFLEDAILDSSSPHIQSAQRATDGQRHSKPESKGRETLWQTNQSQGLEDVDLLRVTPASSGSREDASHIAHTALPLLQSSSKEPSSASFVIAPPSRLTASQKREYLRLSDISETERESQYEPPSLPPPKPPSGDCLSPNTEPSFESTIPDPDHLLAGQLPGVNSFGELPTSCASGPRPDVLQTDRSDPPFQHDGDAEQWQPPSSPDILNADLPSASTRKLKRKRRADAGQSHTEGEDWDSDDIGYGREQYVPRPSRRRSGVEPSPDDSGATGANATSSAAKRQKQQATIESRQNHDSDSQELHRHPQRPVSRHKRSRRTGVIEEDEDEDQQDTSSMPDTCPPDSFLMKNDITTEPLLSSPRHEPQDGPSNDLEGLDANFLAALPEDIRQEVIADHLAQQSARRSQTTRTRNRRRLVEMPNEQQPLSTHAPQTQKRGRRKKKEQEQGSDNEAPITAPESEATMVPEDAVRTKRKRGRPRKAEAVQLTDSGPDASLYATTAAGNVASALGAHAEDDAMKSLAGEAVIGNAEAEPKAPAKRGRKRKMVKETAPTTRATQPGQEEEDSPQDPLAMVESRDAETPNDEHAEVVNQREPLQDISNSVAQSGSQGALESLDGDKQQRHEQGDAVAVGPTTAADPTPRSALKMAAGGGGLPTGGKAPPPPPLRVGLSKKSRIAPLLKVIRK